MKRYISILLCILCLLGIPLQAGADVIVLPENDFFQREDKVFQRVYRQYVAKGIAAVYESPEDDTVVDTIDDTDPITISYSYTDSNGMIWGLYDDYGVSIGWIPMRSLTLVYDLIAFLEDYGEQVQKTRGNVSDVYSGEYAKFHSYPGSPDYELCKVTEWNYSEENKTYSMVYVDANGHTWIMVDKTHSIDDIGWIDVTETPPVPETQAPTRPAADDVLKHLPSNIKKEERKDPLPTVALVLWIVALVMATWLLLLLLKKKK